MADDSIVTVTLNPCLDKTLAVDRVIADRKLQAQDVRRYPGGGGLNVARAIVRLGGASLALWTSGGPIGEVLAERLAAEEVPHEPVEVGAFTRENVIVTETSSDQQYRFGMPGPRLDGGALDAWRAAILERDPPRYLVISGSLPPGVAPHWLTELIEAVDDATRVVVDTKGDALRDALDAGVFLAKPNARELADLASGLIEAGDDRSEEAARELIERDAAEAVLVSLGRGGALLVTAESATHVRAPSVRVQSKVGAGDSMVGGLVLALARGEPLLEAARFGVAAGTAAVLRPGTELCRREDAQRLYDKMPAAKT